MHESSGFPRLDERAADTVRRWKFQPARQGGQPVEAWVIVPIQFSLKG
jgi:protein TonB